MSFHTDVWGFAACIVHIFSGQQPYPGLSQLQIVSAMLKGRPPVIPSAFPEWLQQILKQCFSFDATARPSVLQLHQVHLTTSQNTQACLAVHAGRMTFTHLCCATLQHKAQSMCTVCVPLLGCKALCLCLLYYVAVVQALGSVKTINVNGKIQTFMHQHQWASSTDMHILLCRCSSSTPCQMQLRLQSSPSQRFQAHCK